MARLATKDEIAACRQATKLKPDYVEAWVNLGSAYFKAGKRDEAIAAYRRAIKINPDFAEAWKNLSVAYKQAGKAEESAAAFERARQLDPESVQVAGDIIPPPQSDSFSDYAAQLVRYCPQQHSP